MHMHRQIGSEIILVVIGITVGSVKIIFLGYRYRANKCTIFCI